MERLAAGEEIIAVIDIPKVIHRSHVVDHKIYDQMVADFRGLCITGRTCDQSMFIPDARLYELLLQYKTIAILKNERGGLSEVEFKEEEGIRRGMKLTEQ